MGAVAAGALQSEPIAFPWIARSLCPGIRSMTPRAKSQWPWQRSCALPTPLPHAHAGALELALEQLGYRLVTSVAKVA